MTISTARSRDDVIAGAVRRPRNMHLAVVGSIHDNAVAKDLGFRGGTIAGSIHMEQAVPLLVKELGQEWFESGTFAAYFTRATVDDEPVQTFMTRPDRASDVGHALVWMETTDGQHVWEGSASVGDPTGPSALADRMTSRGAEELRILAGLKVGEVIDLGETMLDGRRQRDRVRAGLMTEPLPWYDEASPWGPAVASPSAEVSFTFENVKQVISRHRRAGVGLYGAIEIRHLDGPLCLDQSYHVTSTIRALGCTPKTEYMWTETVARRGGTPVTSVLMMSRVMKASSDLYA